MKALIFLFITLMFTSCLGWEEINNIIHYEDPEELVIADTCDVLEHLSDTSFVVLTLYFVNGKPDNLIWGYEENGSQQLTSDSLPLLLEQVYPQFDYTYYESDESVTVFIDGTNDNSLFQYDIWAGDDAGQHAHATAWGENFITYGALTYEESLFEANHRLNFKGFHLSNTDWTEEQNNTFCRTIMHFDLCKHGEMRANFSDKPVVQTVKDSAHLYLWNQVINFNDVPGHGR